MPIPAAVRVAVVAALLVGCMAQLTLLGPGEVALHLRPSDWRAGPWAELGAMLWSDPACEAGAPGAGFAGQSAAVIRVMLLGRSLDGSGGEVGDPFARFSREGGEVPAYQGAGEGSRTPTG